MIITKNKIYPLRGNEMAKIQVEIIHIIDDFKNNQFIYTILDSIVYDKENEQRITPISEKKVIFLYEERDNLKLSIINEFNFTGSESEINKQMLPHALLYINQLDPIYCTDKEDWEISIN